MFGVLYLERDPLRLADVPAGLTYWVQVVGTLAALILVFWLIGRAVHALLGLRMEVGLRLGPGMGLSLDTERAAQTAPSRPWLPTAFLSLLTLAALGFLALLVIRMPDLLGASSGSTAPPDPGRVFWGNLCWTIGSAAALLAVCLPFLINLVELRWRRIWAVAKLSFKEAVRRRILYVFSILIVVLLFLNWFVQSKPELQLQDYVEIVYRTMTPVLVLSATLLGAFAIPTDIKQQTIHTVVTKPIERFEIVLGRVLGYMLLLTLVLFAMTSISLLYVLRGVNPEAAAESLKARVPVYGSLDFYRVEAEYTEREEAQRSTPTSRVEQDVGREWAHRKHIAGQPEDRPNEAVSYAVWSFRDLPGKLADRDFVRCEFNFDIYRTTKGQENRGVLCSFFFETRNFEKTRANLQKYQDSRRARGATVELTPEVDNEVSQEFGYFEVQGKVIEDFHTLYIDVPAGLVRNALGKPSEHAHPAAAPLHVRVRCSSPGQLVGMARYDLYFRADDPQGGRDTLAFVLNFYKGTLGLWMVLLLVVALSVAISTQLGGVISFLCVMLLYLGGMFREFIQELAKPGLTGGGPVESAFRLFRRTNLTSELEPTTLVKVATTSDEVFRWLMQGTLQVLPDTERFGFTDRVANGFNVALVQQDLLPALLLLLGYLFPWALLSFYLIRSREIAGAH